MDLRESRSSSTLHDEFESLIALARWKYETRRVCKTCPLPRHAKSRVYNHGSKRVFRLLLVRSVFGVRNGTQSVRVRSFTIETVFIARRKRILREICTVVERTERGRRATNGSFPEERKTLYFRLRLTFRQI